MPPEKSLDEENIAIRELDLPEGEGLAVRLDRDGTVCLTVTADQHYPEIHPNCFGPADMTQVRLLHGGGSGTAVFHGYHPRFADMVMKHGGAKDTKEVFALAAISEELIRRGKLSENAAQALRNRIPEFVMVYLSPRHLRNRAKELWSSLRGTMIPMSMETRQKLGQTIEKAHESESNPALSTESLEPSRHGRRAIRISNQNDCVELEVQLQEVVLYAPTYQSDGTISNGITFLHSLAKELERKQQENNWKVTLGQKTIGGPTSENGATVLSEGHLEGQDLDLLIREFTNVIHELRSLTFPEEEDCLEEIKKEVATLEHSRDVEAVSKAANSFVGSAIVKNFHPVDGRFPKLRQTGHILKNEADAIDLTEAEESPAYFLRELLQRDVHLSKLFVDPPGATMALDSMEHCWLDILRLATSLKHPSATKLIWTCGLTDAGLHNTFLGRERGLELFDLGEPNTLPQPAFLTKFLMSFFHTLGMEDDGHGGWVRRFDVVDDKLQATPATANLLPYISEVFTTVMDHFIAVLFNGDENVRVLLVKYAVLQLLSDASFCLMRWEMKGGGKRRYGPSSASSLEKWLWRSVWDLYIASYVYNHFLPVTKNDFDEVVL